MGVVELEDPGREHLVDLRGGPDAAETARDVRIGVERKQPAAVGGREAPEREPLGREPRVVAAGARNGSPMLRDRRMLTVPAMAVPQRAPENDPQEPELCPECRQADGIPVAVSSGNEPGYVVVTLRCEPCGHRWFVTRRSRGLFGE